ncbi:MAG: hypothetical protein BWY67_02533 [Bacteroidetes bacterium ADurb.Bin397]|nr:MAG: hypothetical protein BWY67_02533 [Bacteroidetes bacterium ADurb.Bin397]
MTAENPEFQAVSDEGQVVLDNTFIMYSDENGIARFENMLGIYPLPTDTLESRQSRVLTRWNDVVPYTLKAFISKIAALQGNDNIQITFFGDQYKLQVVTHLEKHGQQDDLNYLFKTVLPCNLVVESINILDAQSNVVIGIGGGMTYTGVEFITNDINEKFDEVSEMVFGNGITSTEIISIKTSI